ncbi:hypothetical protein NL676_029098 [Syzygium grande]|nr:hypothetical protein NL676_029098 [Syzygium grande]
MKARPTFRTAKHHTQSTGFPHPSFYRADTAGSSVLKIIPFKIIILDSSGGFFRFASPRHAIIPFFGPRSDRDRVVGKVLLNASVKNSVSRRMSFCIAAALEDTWKLNYFFAIVPMRT